jgi:argininosuccinate lyase
MAKFIDGMGIDEDKLRAGFIPGVFATDVALRKVAGGIPWREAYHAVRDNLEALSSENPDDAVAAKTHIGATAGLDWKLYDTRIEAIKNSAEDRRTKFKKQMEELLG